MALIALPSTTFTNVQYDPEVIEADTVLGFLQAGQEQSQLVPTEDVPDDLPAEVIAMLESGATQSEAIDVLRKAFVEDGFLQDETFGFSDAPLTSVDAASLFEEAVAEIEATPALGQVDPAIAEANAKEFGGMVRFAEADGQAAVYIGDDLAFTLPLATAKSADLERFILFVQTVLDSVNLCFALLGVGAAAKRKWALDLTKKLGKAKSWVKEATKAFGYFKTAHLYYKGLRDGGKSRRDAAIDAADRFAGAFLGFAGLMFRRCLKIVRAVLGLVFGTWREAAKICLKLLAALAQWIGTAIAKFAKAVIDAIIAGLAIWDDIDAWEAL